jgi:hypothetical protein
MLNPTFWDNSHFDGFTTTGLLLPDLSRMLPLASFDGVGDGTTKDVANVSPTVAVRTLVRVTRPADDVGDAMATPEWLATSRIQR